MAETTHSLRLKAVLDTKEVQQELEKLRNLQTQNAGVASTSNLNSISGKLTGLNSTMAKLNATMAKLNASQVFKNPTQPKPSPNQPNAGVFGADSKWIKPIIGTMVAQHLGSALKEYAQSSGTKQGKMASYGIDAIQSTIQGAMMGQMAGPWGMAIGATAGLASSLIGSYGEHNRDQIAQRQEEFQQMLKSIAEDENRSKFVKALNENISWQAQIGQYGKPKSAAEREALIGVDVTSEMHRADASKYEDELKKLQSMREDQDLHVKSMVETLNEYNSTDSTLKPMVQLADLKARKRQIDDGLANGEYEEKNVWKPGTGLGPGYSLVREHIPSTEKEMREKSSALQKQISMLEQHISEFDTASKDLPEAQKRLAEIESKIADLENKRLAALEAASTMDKTAEENKKKMQGQADKVWKAYKQFNEERENKSDTLSNPDDRYNYYTREAQSLENQFKETVYQATYAGSAEEAKSLLEKAQQLKDSWDFSRSQADFFGDQSVARLQEKLGALKAPDMTQVTSLASQGKFISKSDDEIKWKQQTDYISQQTTIQREIRDRLNSMNSGSVFQ